MAEVGDAVSRPAQWKYPLCTIYELSSLVCGPVNTQRNPRNHSWKCQTTISLGLWRRRLSVETRTEQVILLSSLHEATKISGSLCNCRLASPNSIMTPSLRSWNSWVSESEGTFRIDSSRNVSSHEATEPLRKGFGKKQYNSPSFWCPMCWRRSRKRWYLRVAYRVLLMMIVTHPCTPWPSRLVPCPFWSWLILITLKRLWNQRWEDRICEVSTMDLEGKERGKQILTDIRMFDHLLMVVSARRVVTVSYWSLPA